MVLPGLSIVHFFFSLPFSVCAGEANSSLLFIKLKMLIIDKEYHCLCVVPDGALCSNPVKWILRGP